MSTTALTTLPTDVTPAAIAAAYGIPSPDSKTVQSALKSIKDAGKDWQTAAREVAPTLYADPSRLARDVARSAEFAAAGRAIVDGTEAIAARLVMTVRQVNPKASAVAIGRAAEGDAADSPAFRQRWSRYARAAALVATSAAAVKAGKGESEVTVRQALTALQNAYVPTDTLMTLAAEGKAMPTKGEAAQIKGESTEGTAPKARTGADVVRAVAHLADVVKACDLSTLTTDQRSEIARMMDSVRTRLTPAKPAAPKAPAA
jgi:hypothetical protein